MNMHEMQMRNEMYYEKMNIHSMPERIYAYYIPTIKIACDANDIQLCVR